MVLDDDKVFQTSDSTEGGAIAQISVKIDADTGDIYIKNLSDWSISQEPYVYHVSDTSITINGGKRVETEATFKIHNKDTFISNVISYTDQKAWVV